MLHREVGTTTVTGHGYKRHTIFQSRRHGQSDGFAAVAEMAGIFCVEGSMTGEDGKSNEKKSSSSSSSENERH